MKSHLFLLLFLLFSACSALAGPEEIEAAKQKLMEQELRPTVADFLAAFGGELPAENPFPRVYDHKIEALAKDGPKLIAQLEYAYPGAVWAVLGRDAAFSGLILEAYYQGFGINERVVRLDASSGSFAKEGNELRLLYSAGLLNSPEAEAERRFVVLDPASWTVETKDRFGELHPPSQLLRIVRAYYDRHRGKQNFHFVNAIGLGSSSRGKNGVDIKPSQSITKFFNEMAVRGNVPAQILYTIDTFTHLGARSRNDDIEVFWHDSFGPFSEADESGRIKAQVGPRGSVASRRHILWMTYEIIRTVRSVEFANAVRKEAKKYGYRIDKILETDFAALESDEKFSRFARGKRWTVEAVEEWRKSFTDGMPESLLPLTLVRMLELTVIGVDQGSISEKALMTLLKNLLARCESDGWFAEKIANFSKQGRNAILPAVLAKFILREDVAGIAKVRRLLESPEIQAENGLIEVVANRYANDNVDKLPTGLRMASRRAIDKYLSFITKDSSLDARMIFLDLAMNLAQSPDDVLKILQYHVKNPESDYKPALIDYAIKKLPRFFEIGATVEDLKKLKLQLEPDFQKEMEFTRAGLSLVKSAKDYVTLTEFTTRTPSDEYRAAMVEFILETIAGVEAMTIDAITAIEGRTFFFYHDHVALLKIGMKFVRNFDDYIKLVRFKVKYPEKGYSKFKEDLLLDTLDELLEREIISISGVKRIESELAETIRMKYLIMDKGIGLVRTPREFAELTKYTDKDLHYRNWVDEYRKTLPKFAHPHIKTVPQLLSELMTLKDPVLIAQTLNWGLEFVHTAKDFVLLMTPPATFGVAIAPIYEEIFLGEGKGFFEDLKPSRDEAAKLLSAMRPAKIGMNALSQFLPVANSSGVYLELLKFGISGIGWMGSEKGAVLEAIQKTLPVFMRGQPTNANLSELQKIVRAHFKVDLHLAATSGKQSEAEASLKKVGLWKRFTSSANKCPTAVMPKN